MLDVKRFFRDACLPACSNEEAHRLADWLSGRHRAIPMFGSTVLAESPLVPLADLGIAAAANAFSGRTPDRLLIGASASRTDSWSAHACA